MGKEKESTSLYESSFPGVKTNGTPKKRKRSLSSVPGHLETHSYAKTYDNQKPCTAYCAQPSISIESWAPTPESSQLVQFGGPANGLPPPPKLTKTIKTEDDEADAQQKFALSPPPLLKQNPMAKWIRPELSDTNTMASPKKKCPKLDSGEIKRELDVGKAEEQTVATSTEDLPANGIIANSSTYQSSVSCYTLVYFSVNCFHVSFGRRTIK